MNVKFFYIILVHILIKITGNLSTDLISNDDDDSDDNKGKIFKLFTIAIAKIL